MIADMVGRIGGDRIRLKGLMAAGVDPHLYEPVPADGIALREADIEISDEAAEALSHHRSTMLLNGLTKLTSVPLTTTMLKSDDGFLNLSKVQTLSDEVVQVFAEYQGSRSVRLTGLTELSEANAARLRANEKIVLPSKFQRPEQQ